MEFPDPLKQPIEEEDEIVKVLDPFVSIALIQNTILDALRSVMSYGWYIVGALVVWYLIQDKVLEAVDVWQTRGLAAKVKAAQMSEEEKERIRKVREKQQLAAAEASKKAAEEAKLKKKQKPKETPKYYPPSSSFSSTSQYTPQARRWGAERRRGGGGG